MKRIAGFLVLLAILAMVPATFASHAPVQLSHSQMAAVSGSGEGCDALGGFSAGLGIAACFGCGPCAGGAAIGGALYYFFC